MLRAMGSTVSLPLWLFILILLFAAVTALSHFLLPSVRWFFRRRMESAVARLNKRLARPIEPFRLARRYDMIQRLIYDPEVSREIAAFARRNKVPENVAFQKAQAYAREIVPSFSAFTYFSFGTRAAGWLAKAVYRVNTAPRNNAVLASVPKDATAVFIINHRSNMDYVLVTYLAARASALSYAVGEWAKVWPLSSFIRWMGAYFIRRHARGALYRKVLARYVHMATEGGLTQAVFPEGGLSLTGALQKPKMGLLSYVVDGFDPEGERDVVFVPVAINYDRVLEDRVLIAAHQRGDRRFGARITVVVRFILRKFWQRIRGRDTRFGAAAVAFGAPLSLRSLGAAPDVDLMTEELMGRIAAAMPIPIVPLIAQVLSREALDLDGIEAAITEQLKQLPEENFAFDVRVLRFEIERGCRHMQQHMIIEEEASKWRAALGQEDVLAFYANSIAYHLGNNAA